MPQYVYEWGWEMIENDVRGVVREGVRIVGRNGE